MEGLLMQRNRIIIPTALRSGVLKEIHSGHQGVSKCRERAAQSVWWSRLSSDLEELTDRCIECRKVRVQRPEPLIPSTLPELPWQKFGTDLFKWQKGHYLLVVDYFSRYIEIAKLVGTTAVEVISQTKSIFTRHRIPEVVMSDNGHQFSAKIYSKLASDYQFKHVTSSPYFP